MCFVLDEIWSLIFKDYLELADAVRMREVCKRFRFLVDQLGLTELLVCRFYYPFEGVFKVEKNPDHWIKLRNFKWEPNSPKFIAFHAFFTNLKCLHLDNHLDLEEEKFNIEVLNEFTRLEKLHVNQMWIERDQVLRLPKLKTLSVRVRLERECRLRPSEIRRLNYDLEPHLVVDSKVETLVCGRLNLIRLNHPECIEFLESEISNGDHLLVLTNLRVLHSKLMSESIFDHFQSLENLQEIHLSWDRIKISNTGQHLIRMIDQLRRKNSELKKNVKIYLLDVPLTQPLNELFPELIELGWPADFLHRLYEERIRQYHNLVTPVTRVEKVDYQRLIGRLDAVRGNFLRNQVTLNERQFPEDFFRKFQDIRRVQVTQAPVDEARFGFFLEQCPRLIDLEFESDSLRQPVLNRLPNACRRLKNLVIVVGPVVDRLDFSPVYMLKQLFSLTIQGATCEREAFSVNSLNLIRLLEECRYLSTISLISFSQLRVLSKVKEWFFLTYRKNHIEIFNLHLLTYEELKSALSKVEN